MEEEGLLVNEARKQDCHSTHGHISFFLPCSLEQKKHSIFLLFVLTYLPFPSFLSYLEGSLGEGWGNDYAVRL